MGEFFTLTPGFPPFSSSFMCPVHGRFQATFRYSPFSTDLFIFIFSIRTNQLHSRNRFHLDKNVIFLLFRGEPCVRPHLYTSGEQDMINAYDINVIHKTYSGLNESERR